MPVSSENVGSTEKPLPLMVFGAPGVGTEKYPTMLGSTRSRPYEISSCCAGYGSNVDTMFVCASTSARKLPALLDSRKFVCNGPSGARRSFSEAHTLRYPLTLRGDIVAGNRHFVKFRRSSVRYHPLRLASTGPRFRISIQSDLVPSSSWTPFSLSAMNSDSTTTGRGAEFVSRI